MHDLRHKVRLNKGELPTPNHDGPALEPGVNCATLRQAGRTTRTATASSTSLDYAVRLARRRTNEPRRVGPAGPARPAGPDHRLLGRHRRRRQRLRRRHRGLGLPRQRQRRLRRRPVRPRHRRGEGLERRGQQRRPDRLLPELHGHPAARRRLVRRRREQLRAGGRSTRSTTACSSSRRRSARSTTRSSRAQAVDYAYDHGVAVIASAADEAAQHHNWPSNYPHTIVVNSVNQYDDAFTPTPRPTCSSTAARTSRRTSRSRSRARAARRTRPASAPASPGLIYSAALNAQRPRRPRPAPELRARRTASPASLSANEVRQLMAIGHDRRHRRRPTTSTSRPSPSRPATRLPAPGCTDPNRLFADATAEPAGRHRRSPTTQELPGAQGLRRVLRLRPRRTW